MGKYAVVGDSYAVVDDDDSHWAKIWGEQNGHTVDFFGLEGSNLVNISYLFENIPFDHYDGVIIHYTSPLRAEVSTTHTPTPESINDVIEKPVKKIYTVMQMSDVYANEIKSFFNYVHPNDRSIKTTDGINLPKYFDCQYYHEDDVQFLIKYYNLMPHWYDSFDLIDSSTSSRDALMADLANKFYESISIRWLLRANFLAYRNIILNLEAKNIKNVTVFPVCGGFISTISHIKEKYPTTKVWDQTQILRVHPTEVKSRNHVSLDHAHLLASKFSFDM